MGQDAAFPADLHYPVRTAGVSGGLIDVESAIANNLGAPLKRKLIAIVPMLCLSALAYAGPQEQTFTEITPGAEAVNPDNLIPLLERGDVRAMNNIGLLWARGVGVSGPNFTEALHWWKEAAKRGYPVAMNNIGLLYANGHGVPQDYKEALKWWRMASERGNAWAMNSIGDLYENGQGVEQSYAEALDWYGRAAQAGDGLAMYNLGSLYENGRGVEQSFKTAYDWYNRSADKGIASAMHNLGRMFAGGRGFPADRAEAHAWLTVAGKYYGAEDKAEAEANIQDLQALTAGLSAAELGRAREIAENLAARIEERRKAEPLQAGPGESET
jgi:TPR repeat protein